MSTTSFNVLLDLDGTLTDSEQGILRSMRHALQMMNRPPQDDIALRKLIGPPTRIAFERLLGSDDRALVDTGVALYRERFARVGLYENRLYPGIGELLDGLRALGCTLFLATSKPLVYARRIVEHFAIDRHFTGLYGAGLDGTHADKAELIRHLLTTERLDASHCLMVGDRRHDVLGARANGVAVCSVRWGYGDAEELRVAAPDFQCERPADLLALVRRQAALRQRAAISRADDTAT
jgi:phosphoglycolate phosphatase